MNPKNLIKRIAFVCSVLLALLTVQGVSASTLPPSISQIDDQVDSHTPPATLTVAHFAPFADSVDGTSVTVEVNGQPALTNFKFGDIQKNIQLPAGLYHIAIKPTGSSTAVISVRIRLERGKDYTAAAIGDGVNQPIELLALLDNNHPIEDKTRVRVGHMAPFANTLNGTKVNICTDDGTPVFQNVTYKGILDLALTPGVYDLKVVPVANGCGDAALDLPAVKFSAKEIIDLFVIGNISKLPLALATTTGVTTAPEPEQKPATVTVAHFAPFANSVDGTSVTVRVNGGDAITNFKFGDIAKNVELPPGNYLIEIVPTGTNTVAISANVTLEPGKDYTAAAIGDVVNQPLELLALLDNNEPINDKARVRVGHLAPFANTLEGTKVDVCTDTGTPVFEDVVYKGVLDLELPEGVYDLKVVPVANNCGAAALDLPAVKFSAKDVVDLFVIGNIANLPLTFATTTGVTTAPEPEQKPATVTVAHFAPFANSVDGTSVTVRVNGGDAITNFKFGDIAKNVELPPGNYLIEILPTGTNTVAISANVTLEPGKDYTAAAIGDVVNQPLELLALLDNNEPINDKARVRVGHLAPFANTLEGTKVDICTDDGTPVFEDVVYKGVLDLELPEGVYDLKVVPVANNCGAAALDLPAVKFSAKDVVDLFVIGNIANLPLTFATTTGVTTVPEPDAKPATVTVAHFAPFAFPRSATAVSVLANGDTLIDSIRFGQIRHNLKVPGGEYLIELVSKRTNSTLLGQTIKFEPDTRYLVAAIGGGRFLPLEIFVLTYSNNRWQRSAGADTSLLRIAHLAPLASKLDDTRIDICTDSGTLVLTDVPYKAFATLELPAGDYDLKVSSLGANCADMVLDLPPVTLVAGEEREVYTVGDNATVPLQALFADPLSEEGVEQMMRLFLPSLNR